MRSAPPKRNEKAQHTGKPVKPKRWWYPVRVLLIVLSIVLFGYAVQILGASYAELLVLNEEVAQVEAELAAEEERHEDLEREIDRLQTDDYLEVIARDKLRMIRPGDIPYNWGNRR